MADDAVQSLTWALLASVLAHHSNLRAPVAVRTEAYRAMLAEFERRAARRALALALSRRVVICPQPETHLRTESPTDSVNLSLGCLILSRANSANQVLISP